MIEYRFPQVLEEPTPGSENGFRKERLGGDSMEYEHELELRWY